MPVVLSYEPNRLCSYRLARGNISCRRGRGGRGGVAGKACRGVGARGGWSGVMRAGRGVAGEGVCLVGREREGEGERE